MPHLVKIAEPISKTGTLKARIARKYQTVTESITLAGRTYSFTRIADPNRVLDQVAAEEDRLEKVHGRRKDGDYLHLPYWAELWDSAYAMGQLLLDRFAYREFSVLDLGCGMGFTGMVAASLEHRVCFADLEPDALLFAQLNAMPFGSRTRARQTDWRRDQLGERFDVILGADILYERKQWEYLERFWQSHLAENGRVLLGEPGRKTGDDFPAWIEKLGWKLSSHLCTIASGRSIRLFEVCQK
jgi:predicted nicotinamide N-methyase